MTNNMNQYQSIVVTDEIEPLVLEESTMTSYFGFTAKKLFVVLVTTFAFVAFYSVGHYSGRMATAKQLPEQAHPLLGEGDCLASGEYCGTSSRTGTDTEDCSKCCSGPYYVEIEDVGFAEDYFCE